MEFQLNSTLIALIPKKKDAIRVTEYRPISLCNVSYKIISKVLANRLGTILPKIVQGNQSAFISGRLITDNVIVAFEALHSMSLLARSRTNYMAVKLDMSKAYDRVEWNFLQEVMAHIIYPTRGIRQGDPLSQLLFVLCTEALCSNLHMAHNVNLFRGFLLLINFNKTSIFISRFTLIQQRRRLVSMIGATEAKRYDRYLGLAAIVGRSRRSAFLYVLDKINKRVASWSHRTLSQAGKEIFIKAVLQAIPTYAMQLFKFPKNLCNEMDNVLRKVWWGNNAKNNPKSWLPWSKLCEAKKDGGMGFRNFEAFNDALLAKQGWRILTNPDSLASRVLKAKYFPGTNFLHVEKGRNASFLWASLLGARGLLQDGLKWRIGNGARVHIWQDHWLPKHIYHGSHAEMMGFNKDALVGSLIDWSLNWWNVELLNHLFDEETSQFILQQSMGSYYINDSLYWSGTSNGVYTVKSGYHRAMEIRGRTLASSSDPGDDVYGRVWNSVWSLVAPPSTKVANNGILTADEFTSASIREEVAQLTSYQQTSQEDIQIWRGPALNYIKANWDAATHSQTLRTGFGVVFRDVNGDVMACSTLDRPSLLDSTLAEAFAALHAIKLACDLGFTHLILEGDSSIIVAAIGGEEMYFSAWRSVILEIRRLLTYFHSWSVYHVRRNVNSAAHALAKFSFHVPGLRLDNSTRLVARVPFGLQFFCPSVWDS
ncbi:uncharacterized protein LOC120007259 [Tripterygium wilfordii]|uniref:uncharacterized protein LOC120007259 n=1 Tax=Tripterygium wilfordii TaxID=458696 RepID=UPI0018F852C3|nr:uncharacterized protein LOC120007259 [Tripterygium wilfordii]